MKKYETPSLEQLDERFQQGLLEEIPETDIQQFRQTFENAWKQRTTMGRFLSKPLFPILVLAVALPLTLGSGYSFLQGANHYEKTNTPPPILMSNQRMINNPDLLSLFPAVDHPTLIETKIGQEKNQQTYLVHGYDADENIQILWEY